MVYTNGFKASLGYKPRFCLKIINKQPHRPAIPSPHNVQIVVTVSFGKFLGKFRNQ